MFVGTYAAKHFIRSIEKYFRILYQERNHTPVDAVGTITLGSILLCKVSAGTHIALLEEEA